MRSGSWEWEDTQEVGGIRNYTTEIIEEISAFHPVTCMKASFIHRTWQTRRMSPNSTLICISLRFMYLKPLISEIYEFSKLPKCFWQNKKGLITISKIHRCVFLQIFDWLHCIYINNEFYDCQIKVFNASCVLTFSNLLCVSQMLTLHMWFTPDVGLSVLMVKNNFLN